MNKDNNDSTHWKLGIFYYNPENPAGFVDKRSGVGITVNFASKSGRRMLALILVPAAIIILILIIIGCLK